MHTIRMEKHKKEAQEGLVIVRRYVDVCALLIDAIGIALKDIPESHTELRPEIISFSRAVASVRYTIEDIFNFIEATHPPKKTTSRRISMRCSSAAHFFMAMAVFIDKNITHIAVR